MGSEEDPEDGAAVAASVFGAVAIYGVCQPLPPVPFIPSTDLIPGFPRLLRRPSLSAPTRQIKRRHRTVMIPLLPLTTSLHLLESSIPSLEMTSIICPSVLRQHHDHLYHFLLLRRGVTVSASHTRRHVDSLTERQLGVLPLFIPIIDLLHLGSFHSFIFVLLSTPPPMLISLPNAP